MKISWFEENEGHLWDTDGESPNVGDKVYFRDYSLRGGAALLADKDRCWEVVNKSISLSKGSVDISSIKFPEDMDDTMERFDFLMNEARRLSGGRPQGFDVKDRKVFFVKHELEVSIRRLER
jgi:hypothetical protein